MKVLDVGKLNKKYPKHKTKFLKKDEIGQGAFGNIFSRIFLFKNKEYPVVEKEYKFFGEDYVKTNFLIWNKLKSKKVPTFKFMRVYNEISLIMENLSTDNKFCVSLNNFDSIDYQYLTNNKIDDIINFKDLIVELLFLNNRMDGFYIFENFNDFLFFIGDKKPNCRVNVIVGDFDNILLDKKSGSHSFEFNDYYFVQVHIKRFIELFVRENKKSVYYLLLDKIIDELKCEFGVC